MIQIGIDFGGTKIEAAALDASGNYLERIRIPNPGAYDLAVNCVCDLVAKIEERLGARGSVGIGVPGSISPRTGLMRNANSVYLNGRPFREDLCNRLDRDVRMANDANCLALSEAVDGSAAGARVVFAIILGTGCGGGIAISNKVHEGGNGIAGEWGHNPLPWPDADESPGPQCWCGQYGCLENWISGSGLQRDYFEHTGRELSGEKIITDFRVGDPAAVAAVGRLVHRLGRAIATLSNTIDPEVIVIGGGLSNVSEIYRDVPSIVKKYVFSDMWETPIYPAKWGDASGVRGAARLWPRQDSATDVNLVAARQTPVRQA